MFNVAFAMGQGGAASPGAVGGLMSFIPLIIFSIIIVGLVMIISKKKGNQNQIISGTKCEDCGIIFTRGEKFCIKCGNPLRLI